MTPTVDDPSAPYLPRMTRRRCPTILQIQALECGAAALGMILAHYGRWVPLDELRVACGVSRDGSKAKNILAAARGYGLEAKGLKLSDLSAFADLKMPAILFWGMNHFLVLEGIGRDCVHVNDPALGRRAIGFDEFDEYFTGVVLTFAAGPGFVPGGRPPSFTAAVGRRLDRSWDAVALIILVSLFLVVPGIVIPAISRIFIDDVLGNGLNDWLMPLLLGMALTAVMRSALTWLRGVHQLRLQVKLGISASTQLFWQLLRLPMVFFTQRYVGDVAARIEASRRFADLVAGPLSDVAFNLICAVFYAIVMVLYDVRLAAIGIGLSLVNLAAIHAVAKLRENGAKRLERDEDKLASCSIEGVQLIETLKATGTEPDFFSEWTGLQALVLNGRRHLEILSGLLNALSPLLNGLTSAVVLGYGGLLAMDGAITLGALVAFQSLLASFAEPINRLTAVAEQYQSLKNTLVQLSDVTNTPVDSRFERHDSETEFPAKLAGYLEFRDVSFGYSPLSPPLLEGFSLALTPGSWVALVGGSGSGKSTLGKLAVGLLSPSAGAILLDGEPLAERPRRQVVSSLAQVSQDIFLFDDTIRNNITLWDPTVPEAVVVQAAKDACIHEFIATRAKAYDGHIAEGGRNLSGGQAQRIEIARALARCPSILVLDEATSALDPLTEIRVMENLRRRGCTVIVVAHRLSTIRDCDEIIVLSDGKVLQRGDHDSLRAIPGPYAELIRAE
ncbi:NHLP family bacteriocin export ABC transporter peptidase/permease/ATPase subunit [Paramagnetospirillum marisnigri]